MEKKKLIMVAVVVVCLGIAAAIFFKTRGSDKSGITTIDPSQKVWVKCNNPSCGVDYQMPAKEYFETTDKLRTNPNATPALICQKCKQESVYIAQQCKKCGKIFFPGSFKGDFPDRCTYCNYSYIEDIKNRKAGGGAPAAK